MDPQLKFKGEVDRRYGNGASDLLVAGVDGQSAYEVAVANGFTGDQSAWLASLVGADSTAEGPPGAEGGEGQSAYGVAVANGFAGDVSAWLASLVGPSGPSGPGPVTNASVDGSGNLIIYTTAGDFDAGHVTGGNGSDGATGATGNPGAGVITGGAAGEVLTKFDGSDFNTTWAPLPNGFFGANPSSQSSSLADLDTGAGATTLSDVINKVNNILSALRSCGIIES